MPANERPIDASIEIVTPENIAFRYRVAGPYRRLTAFAVDLLIRLGFCLGVVFGFFMLGIFQFLDGSLAIVFFFLLLFVLEWLYGGFLEAYWNGQTVGKRVMGIRVLSTDGEPINGLQAVLRNILRYVDMMPMIPYGAFSDEAMAVNVPTFVIGLLVPLLNDRFQRLGDLVCGTMVVIDEKTFLIDAAELEDPRVAQLAADLPSNFQVTQTMARALASYVDRRQLFSPPRRREIARHLGEPLVSKFGYPPDTSYDLLLCALYHRTYLMQQDAESELPSVTSRRSPENTVEVPPMTAAPTPASTDGGEAS